MKYWILSAVLLISGISCSTFRHTHPDHKNTQPGTAVSPNYPDSLKMALSYIELGKSAEIAGDSLNADYYFQRAMDITSEIQQVYNSPQDTGSQRMLQEVSLEYSKYLARVNGLEQDTLTAANVQEILDEIDSTMVLYDADSSVVTIQDVIEEDHSLTIPLVLNQKVENAIQYFQGRGRRVFTKWLQRTGWYQDMIVQILKEEGVPEELFYLAMIESGFNPNARSYARAVGIWQFIGSTGQAYGLTSSWWYDERRDPVQSTRAAAQHLRDLYQRFNNWYLAIAGYNFSPGKIEKRMQVYNVEEFWSLPKLPRQTRNYVPTFIAAVHIAKNPAEYGFFVEPDAPIVFDTVTVRECVDLNVVAECVNSTFSELKKLNPALLQWCTPPDREEWLLNIPSGSREEFIKNYAKVPDDQKFTYINHRVRQGETLSQISKQYGVNLSEIKRFNKIQGTLIRAGQYLVIPYPQNKQFARDLAKKTAAPTPSASPSRKPVKNVEGREKFVHVVSSGENLWQISQTYGVTVAQLQSWNGLGYSRTIHPRQELNIWLPVKNGESSGTSGLPNTTSPSASTRTEANTSREIKYTVRSGDTLWDIASRYGVSISDIKKWNNRQSNLIKPGDELRIIPAL